ncbi:succinate dehydrogenase assembly factor 2 [Yoonia sediminilitoris]|uniref:FAD assembly factor SdhE n=1 Tax=Yoonia sediminilitoris TaxID=1286148 RepID=A0A2T6KBA7_9RHOB|nr:succinate dehydrogenase assembly factor 2 [Yoonia sediminilitoris]PUB12107.1 antitoxin CptB [Yoonia sediminilitoris]RCW92934.1 antitoxin CptB [Yoonia sediminilitoris]
MTEDRETMIKRLRMRSMRRGIKEMDLILSDFAQTHLDDMTDDTLQLYDSLLAENDHDIYGWIGEQFACPTRYKSLLARIRLGADGVTRPT